MKKKTRSTGRAAAKKAYNWQFDSTEFLLLVVVAVGMLVFFSWQNGLLPDLGSMVLGVSTSR